MLIRWRHPEFGIVRFISLDDRADCADSPIHECTTPTSESSATSRSFTASLRRGCC